MAIVRRLKKANARDLNAAESSFLEARGIYALRERRARIASDFTWRLRFVQQWIPRLWVTVTSVRHSFST